MVNPTRRARRLRDRQTKAESLLWNVVRAKRLCGLKFRRQHPVGPFFPDFACVEQHVIVELDGGYHEHCGEADLARQRYLEQQGWRVIRFTNEEVLGDVDAVARSLAKQLGLDFRIGERKTMRSGMMCKKPPAPDDTSPACGRGD